MPPRSSGTTFRRMRTCRSAPGIRREPRQAEVQMTTDERRSWEENGFLRLGQVASDEELAALQERMDAIMLGKVVYPGMYFQMDSASGDYKDLHGRGWEGPSLAYRKIQDLEQDPLFLAYMR